MLIRLFLSQKKKQPVNNNIFLVYESKKIRFSCNSGCDIVRFYEKTIKKSQKNLAFEDVCKKTGAKSKTHYKYVLNLKKMFHVKQMLFYGKKTPFFVKSK